MSTTIHEILTTFSVGLSDNPQLNTPVAIQKLKFIIKSVVETGYYSGIKMAYSMKHLMTSARLSCINITIVYSMNIVLPKLG